MSCAKTQRVHVLADALKSNVTPLSVPLRNPYFIIDDGQLLYRIKWSTGYTYDQVCDMYVRHILDYFGTEVTVIFDGYREAMATKVTEQQRRATQNTSHDIIFELDMTLSTPQNRFLANRRNKARFFGHVMTKLENFGVVCSQSPVDADHMSSNTALTATKLLDKPVVLVGNETDLLVMLIDKAIFLMDIYMQFSPHPPTIFCIHKTQDALHANVRNLITSFLLTHLLDAIPL